MTLSPYPVGFPSSSHDAVEAVWLQAWDEFETAKRAAKWNQEIETALVTCIMKVFAVFSEEATRLNLWPLHETKSICNEFLAVTAHKMGWSAGEWLNYHQPTRLTLYEGKLSPEAEEKLHRRPEWRAHIDRLLATSAAPSIDARPTPTDPQLLPVMRHIAAKIEETKPLSELAELGRQFVQIKKEMKKIKALSRGAHRLSVPQIRDAHPELWVWKIADNLPSTAREVFEHPRIWAAGYIIEIFCHDFFLKSPTTMKGWQRKYLNETKTKPPCG
jgi:hypothetical protein